MQYSKENLYFKLGTYLASLLMRAVMKSFTSVVLRAKALESNDHLPLWTHSHIFSSSSSSSFVSTANGRHPLMLKRTRKQHRLQSPDRNGHSHFLNPCHATKLLKQLLRDNQITVTTETTTWFKRQPKLRS